MEDKSGVGLHKRRTESNGKCVCSSTLCSLAGSGSRHLNCHPHLWFVQRFKQGQFVVPVEGCFHCSEEQMTGRWMRTNGLRLTQLNSKSCFFLNASCSVLVSVTLRDQRNNLNLRKKKTFLLIRHRLMRTKCWPCGTTQHLRFAQKNTVLLCFTFSLNWNLYFFEYAPEYKKNQIRWKSNPFLEGQHLCVCFCVCVRVAWHSGKALGALACVSPLSPKECVSCKWRWYQPCPSVSVCVSLCVWVRVFREGRVRSDMSGLESQQTSSEFFLFPFCGNTHHHWDTHTHSRPETLGDVPGSRIRQQLTDFRLQTTESGPSTSQSLKSTLTY